MTPRHARTGAPADRLGKRLHYRALVAEVARANGIGKHNATDLFDIAFSEMSAAAQGLAGLGVRR